MVSHSSPTTFSMLTSSFPCMILHRRNLACIGCGCPRTTLQQQQQLQQQSHSLTRASSSPRFASLPAETSVPVVPSDQSPYNRSERASLLAPIHKSTHPLLTPSGRAFAVGGKVQNISSDPLSPCIMYWPDNEPFPEQGQIRPSGLVGVPVSLEFLCDARS